MAYVIVLLERKYGIRSKINSAQKERGKGMKIELEVSDKNEGTRSPYWVIIDPNQNFRVDHESIHFIASMITGLFFSREEAEEYLKRRRYAFTKNAVVYCHSGHHGDQYDKKCSEQERISEQEK